MRGASMIRRALSLNAFKWAGTIVCIVLGGTIIATRWFVVGSSFTAGSQVYTTALAGGVIWAAAPYGDIDPWNTSWIETRAVEVASSSKIGRLKPPDLVWWPSKTGLGARRWVIRFSLWIPLVIVGLLTASLWWLDRRRPLPGHCRCGYNLTGNTSGRCPECGAAVQVAECS